MGLQNKHTRAVMQETRQRRLQITTLLQAEEDRRYLRDLLERYEAEAKIMQGREDWVVGQSPYTSPDRYTLPVSVIKVNN
jgi:hypothetical protein